MTYSPTTREYDEQHQAREILPYTRKNFPVELRNTRPQATFRLWFSDTVDLLPLKMDQGKDTLSHANCQLD